jgi:hypothetical protein
MSQNRFGRGVRSPHGRCGVFGAIVWLVSALTLTPAAGQAQNFVDFATMSPTAPVVPQRLCYTDGVDVACDGAAGQVTTSGTLQIPNLSANAIGVVNVSATGNIQANQFIGDGSGLSGVVASSADRITSGTTNFVVVSNTGYISLTQGGMNTGWFDPTRGLVTLGVSATGGISATTGYFSQNVGIGTGSNSGANLHLRTGSYASLMLGEPTSSGFHITKETNGSLVFWSGTIGSGSRRMTILNSNNIGIGSSISNPQSTLDVAGTARITSWTAIGANVTPTAPLDVYGTISATGISVTGIVSATRFEGQFSGDGSGLTGVVASTGDRVVSGTTSLVAVSATGFVSLTQGGTNTGWFDPTSGLVTLGVSATGGISGTTGYFSGAISVGPSISLVYNPADLADFRLTRLGSVVFRSAGGVNFFRDNLIIGSIISTPSSTLHISGTTRITSWTAIGANVTPTAALDIYGTVSATNIRTSGTVTAGAFVGDGSGLTGVVASTGDRVVSGTTSLVAVSATGFVSLTQGGTNTGWFDPTSGLVTLGVSATGGISATTGYFGGNVSIGYTSSSVPISLTLNANGDINTGLYFREAALWGVSIVYNALDNRMEFQGFTDAGQHTTHVTLMRNTGRLGLGISNPSSMLHVSGTVRITSWTAIGANVTPTAPLDVYGTISATGISVTGIVSATRFVGDGSGLTGVVASTGDRVVSGTTSLVAVSATGFVSLTQGGTNTGWFDPTRGLVTLGVSATGGISGTTGYFAGNVGVGKAPGTQALDVSGSINLPATVAGVANGMIMRGGTRFVHAYQPLIASGNNLFVGLEAGNTTMTTSGSDPATASNNVGVGPFVLRANTSGFQNTGIGSSVLLDNTTGYQNTASGVNALRVNTTGYWNVAMGVGAMSNNTTGYWNTAIGTSALQKNLSGFNNVALGTAALRENVGGSNNTVLGRNAGTGVSNSEINNSVLIGIQSGLALTSATQNTFVGSYTGDSVTTGSRNVLLGYDVDTPAPTTNDFINIANVISGSISNASTASLTTIGLNVVGAVTATRFVGDGSGLTGVVASTGDRVVSGTTSLVAVSATGFVSLTQGGTNTGWFDPTSGLVTLGVSATGGISGTTGYFSGSVGIGRIGTFSAMLDVSQTDTSVEAAFRTRVLPGSSDSNAIFQGTNSTYAVSIGAQSGPGAWNPLVRADDARVIFRSGSSQNAGGLVLAPWSSLSRGIRIDGPSGQIGIWTFNPQSVLHVSGTTRITSWTAVGANVTATTALDVYGTISATNIQTSGTVTAGTFVGDGSGLTGVVASTGDRVVSGTTSLVAVSATGFVSLTQGGTNTGWFDPTRGLVTLGVSATGGISGTTGYFAGNVGVGAITPSSTLHIAGTTRLTSWTSIGANVAATTALDVYGTASATEVKVGTGTTVGNTCETEQFGTIRRSPVTGRIQVCRPL